MKITHDFHLHTNLSLCAEKTATLSGYIEGAKRAGLKKIGIANHFWDESLPCNHGWYLKQNFAHISEIKPEIEANNDCGVQIYFGCEAEYDCAGHDVALSPAVAEQLDYVIVPNSHTHITMPEEFYTPHEKHVRFMIDAYYDIINSRVSKYITAIAHPFQAVCCPYDNLILINMISDDTFRRMFDQTAEKGIAIEINTAFQTGMTHDQIEASPILRIFRLAKECGCKFIFGSDYHSIGKTDAYEHAEFTANLLGLTEDDIHQTAK